MQNTNHLSITTQQDDGLYPHSWSYSQTQKPPHTYSINENFGSKTKLPIVKLKSTLKQINTIATQYAHSRLIHKQRLEN